MSSNTFNGFLSFESWWYSFPAWWNEVGAQRTEFGFLYLIPKACQSTLENNELDASAAVTVGNYESDYMPSRSSQTL